jgi:hypothetical protein
VKRPQPKSCGRKVLGGMGDATLMDTTADDNPFA